MIQDCPSHLNCILTSFQKKQKGIVQLLPGQRSWQNLSSPEIAPTLPKAPLPSMIAASHSTVPSIVRLDPRPMYQKVECWRRSTCNSSFAFNQSRTKCEGPKKKWPALKCSSSSRTLIACSTIFKLVCMFSESTCRGDFGVSVWAIAESA